MTGIAWLLIGMLCRYVLPYVLEGLRIVGEKNSWHAWPAFQLKYLTSFFTGVIEFGLYLVMNAGAVDSLLSLDVVSAFLVGYGAVDLSRTVSKALTYWRKR